MTVTSFLNFNVGVLGHVDSGKTSLAKALSTIASTASFDKNPQSKERGITLDLGFSSFLVDCPDHLKISGYEKQQFTLVDCPGHASLIRTIIGGAQIIDLMMLVVDITKGMQTQTAECLVIGEITCDKMVVVLNKIDMVPPEKRKTAIDKMKKKMLLTLQTTKFANSPIVAVSAAPSTENLDQQPIGIDSLVETLKKASFIPQRNATGAFLFAVDHCFAIRGQGTVMTGTVLQGTIKVNDSVEIPSLKLTRKIKSMQMFRQPVEMASQGDRVGLCVTQFDPKQLERGLVCTPGSVPTIHAAIIQVQKIRYFKQSVPTKARFHITFGHDTIMAKVSFFVASADHFSFDQEYSYLEELGENENDQYRNTFALLELDKPVNAVPNSLVIGSKFDTDIHSHQCRLAFRGKLVHLMEAADFATTTLPLLQVYKLKHKEGQVERVTNEHEVIARNLFKKETHIQLFVNLEVTLSTGERGVIEGNFGQSGKVKIRIPEGLSAATLALLKKKRKGSSEEPQLGPSEGVKLTLTFKRYVYDQGKRIVQSQHGK